MLAAAIRTTKTEGVLSVSQIIFEILLNGDAIYLF